MSSLLERIKKDKVPRHVAIIMDGNGRWAKKNGKERIYGHQEGTKRVKDVIKASLMSGVDYLTLYTFSKENWKRPKKEVEYLMELLVKSIENNLSELHKEGIRLYIIGDIFNLPEKVKKGIHKAVDLTKNNTKLTLVMALNYGARWEIISAVRTIAEMARDRVIEIDEIDENLFNNFLNTKGIPNPELLIRTSGELRISNFLLWQIAYTELYFTDKYWPEFGEEDFYKAILDYQKRERRFGKISEQLNNNRNK